MNYQPEDIDRLIEAPHEHEHLEFKEDRGKFELKELCKYCVALANEHGGTFVLGVTDKAPRSVGGTAAFPDLDLLKTRLFDTLRFRVEVHEVLHPKGRLLVFIVPSRPVGSAYNFDGQYFMRIGGSIRRMTDDMLRRIHAEVGPEYLLRPALTDLSDADVHRLLDIHSYFDLSQQPHPTTMDAMLACFEQEKFIERHSDGWRISNLGALLFAKNLSDFDLQLKAPRVVVYRGTGKSEIVRDLIGNKGYAVGFQGLIDYINSQLPANEVIGRALRTIIRMYPEEAIRELIANALVHQDIEDCGSYPTVEIYDNRIEITNPGKPLIETDRFIDGNKSRNEQLADIMRRLRICERLSSGIDKVVDLAEAYQLPAPDFRASEYQTSAVLYAHKPFEEMDRRERVRACYQHACLRWVSKREMTNQSLRERFQLPENKAETISRIIADALAEKRIVTDDPENRSRRYAKYVPYWA